METQNIDYWPIIKKYLPVNSPAFGTYVVHVTLVTARALVIARHLELSRGQLQFIEEASMLHDIGIIRTDSPMIGCHGTLPYILHTVEGRKILDAEGLPAHARVAERHIGVGGILASEIRKANLPLPPKDVLAETIEEKIISYADLFFSKLPENLWRELSLNEVEQKVSKYGRRQEKLFHLFYEQFHF